ncbi:MAG: sel1 repeat family protein, partial [Alphaproteobacteria bacterium]|nr:sel1 repeat family protein [Alphaproteobacteria bacterium]
PMRLRRTVLAAIAAFWVSLSPAGAADTEFLKGYVHARNGDPEGAIAVWAPLAERGHLRAQYALGALYSEGEGVQIDMEQAFRWWHMAARAGDRRAQFNIAGMYREGLGVEADVEQAVTWMRRAAEAGNVDAQFGMVDFYAEGYGVPQDETEAMFWLEVALLSGGQALSPASSRLSRTLRHDQFDRVRTRARDWLESR